MRLIDADLFQRIYTCCKKSFPDTLTSVFRFDNEMLEISATSVMPTHDTTDNTIFNRSYKTQPGIAFEIPFRGIPGICFSDGDAGSDLEHIDYFVIVIHRHFTYFHKFSIFNSQFSIPFALSFLDDFENRIRSSVVFTYSGMFSNDLSSTFEVARASP